MWAGYRRQGASFLGILVWFPWSFFVRMHFLDFRWCFHAFLWVDDLIVTRTQFRWKSSMLHGNSRLICRKWRSARCEKTPSSPRGDGARVSLAVAIRNLLKDLPKKVIFLSNLQVFGTSKNASTAVFLVTAFQEISPSGGPKGTLQHSRWGWGWGIWICLEVLWVDLRQVFFPNGGEKLREIPPKYIPPNHSGWCYESVWTCSCPNFQRWCLFWYISKGV